MKIVGGKLMCIPEFWAIFCLSDVRSRPAILLRLKGKRKVRERESFPDLLERLFVFYLYFLSTKYVSHLLRKFSPKYSIKDERFISRFGSIESISYRFYIYAMHAYKSNYFIFSYTALFTKCWYLLKFNRAIMPLHTNINTMENQPTFW